MKKITLCSLIAVFFGATGYGQTDKGDWLVGGSVSINTTEDNSSFSLMPMVGHFFAKGFAAGAEMTVSASKFGEVRRTTLGVGPFARYYFELKEPVFKPLVHAGFSIKSERQKISGQSPTTETGVGFVLGLGGAYFINDNVAIDGLAGYNYTKIENNDGFGGFLFRIGFQVHLLGSEVRRR